MGIRNGGVGAAIVSLFVMLAPAWASAIDPVLVPGWQGVPLCVVDLGRRDGAPILLLHGLTQSHAVFQKQFESRLAEEHRIVAFDLRGHGCSGKPWSRRDYAQARPWAEDIRAVMRAMDLTRPVIVGWSFGALAAMDYLRLFGSSNVRAFVLTGSDGGLVPLTDPTVREAREKARTAAASIPLGIAEGVKGSDRFVQIMGGAERLGAVSRLMDASYHMLPVYARRVIMARKFENFDLAAKVGVPILFLEGSDDGAVNAGGLRDLLPRIPGSRLVMVSGAGHAVFAEEPGRFEQELLSFLTELPN